MEVFVTKYALTVGIFRSKTDDTTDSETITVKSTDSFNAYYGKGQWVKTKEEAISVAEDMRRRKLKSLKKQILRIKAINFDLQIES